MGFDKPAHPYLAAVQALIAFCRFALRDLAQARPNDEWQIE